MNRLVTLILIASLVLACHAEEVAIAPSGAFSIRQEYKGNFVETISFSEAKRPVVNLAGYPWPGHYSISPDEQWILRVQKTGSGEGMAILYRIEKTGRVMEAVGFNSMLWSVADKVSQLKKSDLYHAGVIDFKWAKDNKTITITLRGSNANKSGDGITTVLNYNMISHAIATKTEPDSGANRRDSSKMAAHR